MEQATQKKDYGWILPVAGITVGVFALDALCRKLGFCSSQENEEAATDPKSPSFSAWNPSYWHSISSVEPMPHSVALHAANEIHDYPGIFGDDYGQVLGAIKSSASNKRQVSYIANVFQYEYGEDMYAYLQDPGGAFPWDGLSDAHLSALNKLVKNMPDK